jgi:hypothetical protein
MRRVMTYLFLLEHPNQSVGLLEAMDALMIVIPAAVQCLFALPDFFMELIHGVHHPAEVGDFGDEQLVTNALKGIVDLMAVRVVAMEVMQLLMGVIRGIAAVVFSCSVDFT